MIAHPQHLTPSTATASMTVAIPRRTIPLSWFPQSNLQESTTVSAENSNKEVKMEWST